MKTRFVCLANSFKEGGRCIAGIKLDNNNEPIIVNGHPQWIRPISDKTHGEIPLNIASPFQILDIIEIDGIRAKPELYQSENLLFNISSLSKIGTFNSSNLSILCENKKYIFKTRYPSLSEDLIKDLDHSLILIKPDKWEVIEKEVEGKINPQQRMLFLYNGFDYDFSITDLAFLKNFQTNPNFLKNINEVILSLSVGIKFPPTNRYYKLVAGVIIIRN